METGFPKRKKGLKRTGFKKKNRKPIQRKYRPTPKMVEALRAEAQKEFKEFARRQVVCAACGDPDSHWDAHHVVESQWLKKNHHVLWLPNNALRLCDQFSQNDCHGLHTRKLKKVKLRDLLDENIAFAFNIQGPAAYDYLTRHYDGEDPRVERALKESERANG